MFTIAGGGAAALAYNLTLLLHVAAGFVAMYGGLVPLLTRKGGRDHRRWGRAFTWSMGVAALTAFPLAWWRADLFQAVVGVYSGYLTAFGFRVLRRRGAAAASVAAPLDWALVGCALAAFGAAAAVGAWLLTGGRGDAGAWATAPTARAALAFGLVGFAVALRDLHGLLTRDASLRRRVVDHAVATSLALVSAYSAFLNTQLHRLTGLQWEVDARMLVPVAAALPVVLVVAARWDGRLRRAAAAGLTPAAALGLLPPAGGGRRAEPSPRLLLRRIGLAEGVSFLLLLCVAVPLKRLAGVAEPVRVLGMAHGALFVLYATAVVLTARALRWRWPRALASLAAGVVPLGTFAVEARLRREDAAEDTTGAGELRAATMES